MTKIKCLSLLFCLLIGNQIFYGQLVSAQSVIPEKSKQMILVIADNWDDFHAKLYICEKAQEKWFIKANFTAVCGKKGVAWGIGLFPQKNIETLIPIKREGDLKSPVGIFELGPCMGYAPELTANLNLEYKQLTDSIQGIDDQNSKYYNTVVDISKLEDKSLIDWKSFEIMKRKDDLYKWLFVIRHNPQNIPGAGSLIFLHIWKNENSGTAGCTAVAEQNLLKIIKWLDMSKSPIIVQLPKETYNQKYRDWELPPIDSSKNY